MQEFNINTKRSILKNYMQQNRNILKTDITIKTALLLYLKCVNMLENVHRMHLAFHA